jgi:hypothetical protein
MALSNAEKVRRYRERQKAKKHGELKQPTPPSNLFQRPFFEFFPVDEQVGSQFSQALELAGVNPPLLEDDSGPEAVTLDDLHDAAMNDELSNPFGSSKGNSLGRAEVLVGCLLDAATDLANWINDYKKAEICARIAEIEGSDLSDPEAKRMAFTRVAELTKLREELDKTVRWTLPVWKVT